MERNIKFVAYVSEETIPDSLKLFMKKIIPRLEEYKKHHQNVWPELLNVIRRNGRKNYSIFMTPEGLLFGYFETVLVYKVP